MDVWQIDPPHLSRDALNTTTPNLADLYIEQCIYTHGQLTSPIEQRCLEYCYTKLGTSNGRAIYIQNNAHIPMADGPPQLSIDALNTTAPNLADLYIEQCIYTHGQLTSPIEHRCLEYHCTKLGRSIYRTMHIYPWPIDLPNWAEMPWILLHQTWHI